MTTVHYADFTNPKSGWQKVTIRNLLNFQKEEVGLDWDITQLLSLTKQGVITRDIDSGVGKYPASFEGYQKVAPDDIVFCLFDVEETPRTVGLVKQDGMITSAYTRAVLNKRLVNPRFAEYLFVSWDDEKRFKPFYSGLRNTIPKEVFRGTRLSLPSLKEQERIADYLDIELLQIDNLVSKNSDLLSLLTERRKVVVESAIQGKSITAVSNEQNPAGWLADLSRSWSSGPLKWYARFQTGATPDGAEYDEAEGFPWLRPDDLDASGNVSKANRFVDISGPKGLPTASKGSILMCCIGATLGKVGIIDEVVTFNQQITSISPKSLNSKFLFYVLSAAYEELQSMSVGNTLNILNNSRLGNLKIPIPPLQAQLSVVTFLDEITNQIDELLNIVEKQQFLLGERRATLVREAVSGNTILKGA